MSIFENSRKFPKIPENSLNKILTIYKMDILEFSILTITIFAIDIIYLFITKSLTGKVIKSVQGSPVKIRKFPSIIVYLILAYVLYYFILSRSGNYLEALILGSSIYGVFNFTNLAIFKKWSWTLALIDTLWGGILLVLSTIIYKKITPSKYIKQMMSKQ